jgi:phosphoenolpyruvate carboxykinase (ATP)
MVRAAIDGTIDKADFTVDPIFGLHMPTSCPDVPSEVLLPRNTWADGAAYDRQATDLANRFKKNFTQFDLPTDAVRLAGPR